MSSSNSTPAYDIAIVGLGPVGCTAAILFAEAGLRVIAFERDETVYALPRAVNLDGEIIRAFQKSGRGQVIQDLMQSIRPGDRAGFANSKREWLFGQSFRDFGMNGWQPMNMFDQPELETYLRQQAVSHSRVEAHIGSSVLRVEDYNDHAMVISDRQDDSSSATRARYVVACDGANSQTRKSLDIQWQDLGYDHDWLVVDVTTRSGHTLSNDTVQVCDPERICTYVCTKDPYRRWEFKLNPGETAEEMLDDEMIRSLIDPWTPRDTYDIRRAAVYQFHAATAARWRVGRLFIAGDAAHQTPPFLGQGMNAGMRDVINLAWKLPLVINGDADDSLLDTYFDERNAHAHDLVDWAVSIGRLMEHLAEVERCQQAGLPLPAEQQALKSSGYGQGREQPPLRDGVIMLEQVSDTGSTGYLFAQPVIEKPVIEKPVIEKPGTEKSGRETCRLDDLLGPGFAVVTRTYPGPELSESSKRILETLNAMQVTIEDLTTSRGHFDRLFEEHDAAIIRPDRIVFGHTTRTLSLDDLVQSLASKLALTNP